MPNTTDKLIKIKVEKTLNLLREPLKPRECGTTQQDDIRFLNKYQIGELTIEQIMDSKRIQLSGEFPQKYIGGFATAYPNPKNDKNCCSEIWYLFNTGQPIVYKWKVCKLRNEIKPLNDKAREIMNKNNK